MKFLKTLGGLAAMVAGPELTAGHRDSWFSVADRLSDLKTSNRSLCGQLQGRVEERDFFIREFLPLADVFIQAKRALLERLKQAETVDMKELWALDDEIVRMEMLASLGRDLLAGHALPTPIQ